MPDLRVGEPVRVSLADLPSHAKTVWRELPRRSVVWLTGDLGAGKTAFVTALTRAAGAVAARSPTYALIHEYPTLDGLIAHVDCYRLSSPEEALDLDLLELAAGARLTLIEWPERAGGFAPRPDLHLRFSHVEDADCRLLERIE
jgi:tRNA threonylcarbamoyladenosine biosynthesis protein TsaE